MRFAIGLSLILVTFPVAGSLRAQPVQEAQAAGKPQKAEVRVERLSDQQRAWLAHGARHEKAGWIYLHIQGDARERGFQHGYLLAQEIHACLRSAQVDWQHYTAVEWPWLVEQAKRMFIPAIDAENLAEIDGLAEGLAAAGVRSSRDELVAYNGIIELLYYWWPQEKERVGAEMAATPRQSCSAFIATGSMTADGGVVLGHNMMGSYAALNCYLVLDIQPAQGHRILWQGAPGWIHSGTDFFITDAGLVGAETTIGGFKGFADKGIPEFVRMRRATQDASNIDQWCAIMKQGNNGGYANAWLLGDIRTKEIARLELGLKQVAFEKKQDGYFVGSNVAEDLKLLRFETGVRETDIRLSSVARRVRWHQLMKQHAGKIDVELAKAFEADHADTYLGKEHPGARSLCAHNELEFEAYGLDVPFAPGGTVDGKVVDSQLARRMSFAARWGAACGRPFDAEKFLAAHPQFDWMQGILQSRPAQPWVVFQAGEAK